VATSVNVRNLAYLALIENRQFSTKKPSMWDASRVQITRGVSSIRVSLWALGGASIKTWI
jgi:hypothetical protein